MPYLVAWDAPSGLYAYGPFPSSVEGNRWATRRALFASLDGHRVVGCMLVEPFDQPEMFGEVTAIGSCYHVARDADDRARGFVALVVVSDTVSFGVGLFSCRDAAQKWYLDNRSRLNGAQGLVLPLLSPEGS